MTKTRLEAFSDGVLAIIITIMVLELKVPHGSEWHDLTSLWPVFLSYLLSFVFIAIYWGNHHHLVHTVRRITSGIIWSNMSLLFCLSLIPFSTAWMGENEFSKNTVALYSINLWICAVAFWFLQSAIRRQHETSSALIEALEKQKQKGYVSLAVYSASIPLAYVHPLISAGLIVFTAVIWVIPDRNIERALRD